MLGLPLLDAMVPAFTALARTAAAPAKRLNVIYLPNGMAMDYWLPKKDGTDFEITPVMQPLAPFRDKLTVVSGLTQKRPGSEGGGNHAHASTKFMTGFPGRRAIAGQNSEIEAGISMDQLAARELGRETQLTSLELGLDARDFAGSCDAGFSCAYTNTISWRSATTPLPVENDPRAVFERMFGDSESTDPAVRMARLAEDRSVLDSITEKVSDLKSALGQRDGSKLSEYLDAVRDIERRIQKAEQQRDQDLPAVDQPAGIPSTFIEHARLMFDLQLVAYQADLTRVVTFMIGRELTGRTYPEIGVPEAHHPLSHHEDLPARVELLSKINLYHTTIFSEYLKKLQATPDGDGSLLDHMLVLYGAGMSNSNGHAPNNLPLTLIGGASGQLKGGRHLKYSPDTPVSNLHLAILEKLGVNAVDHLGDSTGKLELLTI